MPDCRSTEEAPQKTFFGIRPRICALAIVSGAVLLVGCGGSGNAISIDGNVWFSGQRVPAELQFEPLDSEGLAAGRSTTAFADERGRFDATIETPDGSAGPVPCRVRVRVSRLTSKGLPASFDYDATLDKTALLKRSLSDGDELTLLLTH